MRPDPPQQDTPNTGRVQKYAKPRYEPPEVSRGQYMLVLVGASAVNAVALVALVLERVL